jgi:hypothetical protein
VSLYAHRLARIIERRSREAAGELVPLHGRTYAEHEAATGDDAQLVEMRRMLGARWEVER